MFNQVNQENKIYKQEVWPRWLWHYSKYRRKLFVSNL